jgi:hypothetical protein
LHEYDSLQCAVGLRWQGKTDRWQAARPRVLLDARRFRLIQVCLRILSMRIQVALTLFCQHASQR